MCVGGGVGVCVCGSRGNGWWGVKEKRFDYFLSGSPVRRPKSKKFPKINTFQAKRWGVNFWQNERRFFFCNLKIFVWEFPMFFVLFFKENLQIFCMNFLS